MDRLILTPLKKIHNIKGDIFHAMKKSDTGFKGFGEAYLSHIYKNEIKGWKQHSKMTLNLVVIYGKIKFVIYDEVKKVFFSETLSYENYKRLTISPDFWFAFKGIKKENIVLNLASIEHDPDEQKNLELDKINYDWESD